MKGGEKSISTQVAGLPRGKNMALKERVKTIGRTLHSVKRWDVLLARKIAVKTRIQAAETRLSEKGARPE